MCLTDAVSVVAVDFDVNIHFSANIYNIVVVDAHCAHFSTGQPQAAKTNTNMRVMCV